MTCNWSTLVRLGEWGKPILSHTHTFVGYPTNLKSPFHSLSGSLCLDERVGIAVAGVLVSSAFAIAATPQIIKAIKSSAKLALFAGIPAAIYAAEKYYK